MSKKHTRNEFIPQMKFVFQRVKTLIEVQAMYNSKI